MVGMLALVYVCVHSFLHVDACVALCAETLFTNESCLSNSTSMSTRYC